MKNLIIFSFLASLTKVCYAQQPVFPKSNATTLSTYSLDYVPDSTSPKQRREIMRLYSSKVASEFVSSGTFLYDSLEATVTAPGAEFDGNVYGQKIAELTQRSPTKFRFRIYKDFSHNQLYHYERVWTTLYQYRQNPPLYNWTILPDQAKINGYDCQRATTSFGGRRYEAWFTREVPIPDGPYKFYGLPGLIVKVADTRGYYTFKLVKIRELPAGPPIALPKEQAKAINSQALQKAREDLKDNAPNLVGAGVSSLTPEDKLKMRTAAKRNNNPLELR